MEAYDFESDDAAAKSESDKLSVPNSKYNFEEDDALAKGDIKKRSATITSISSKFNPDEISQLRYLGKQVGIPENIAERNPEEIKRKALSQKVEQIYDTSPVLVRKMSDPAFAKINHDIIDENSKLESSVKNLSLAAKPMRAAGNLNTQTNINRPLRQEPELTRTWAEAATDPLKSFSSGANTMAAGIVEMSQYLPADKLIRSALKTFAPQLDADIQELFNTTQQGLNEGAQYWQGEKSELMQQKIQQFNNAPIGEALTMLVSDPALLTDQLSQSLPYLIPGAGAARVGQVATTAYITLSEAMDAANSARNEAIAAGATQEQQDQAAARAALVTAPLVFLGNRLVGTDKLEQIFLGSGKLTFGAVNTMLREAFSGSIEEGANQLGVNIGAQTTFDEGRDITQGVGKAAAIGGLLESTQGGAMAGINYAAQMMGKVENDVQQAQTTLQAFNEIQQLAAQSKLKQRSAQDFATFLQEAGGENGIDEVYIDARTFMQEAQNLGVDVNTLMQSSPVIQKQLEEAIAQGIDLVIPVGEFGATIAGTELGGAVLQHLRADENGISAFEAKTQLDTAVEELQKQAENVAQQYQDNEAWTQSLTEVSDNLLGQLNTLGRFTPENNQAYVGGLVAPWYSTLASNLGITPSEAFARYPLQVSGQVTAEGFEQGGAVLSDVIASWDSAGIKSFVSENNGIINISQIVVPENNRGNGVGSKAIQELIDYADSTNQRITLTPSTDYGATSKKRLIDFYKRFGFVENKGKNRDFSTMEGMYREPAVRANSLSLNQSISQTDTPQFKAWFGDSKVVDAEGKPLVVYHGTTADFSEFKVGQNNNFEPRGFYFSPHKQVGKNFSGKNGVVKEVFLNIKNPYIAKNYMDIGKLSADRIKQLKDEGYDGAYFKPTKESDWFQEEYVAFEPTQIKSATGNRGTFDPNDANILNQAVFHGSPYRFDKFSLEHLGKGEGAQAYGWGLYFAGAKEVAEWYRGSLSDFEIKVDDGEYDNSNKFHRAAALKYEAEKNGFALQDVIDRNKRSIADLESRGVDWADKLASEQRETIEVIESGVKLPKYEEISTGQLYKVEIPEDDTMLLWDKPLSEQSKKVISSIKKLIDEYEDLGLGSDLRQSFNDNENGDSFYRLLTTVTGSDKNASKDLNRNGVSGIKYLDGTSRNKNEGTHNYVIFDDNAINVLQTYYQQADQKARGQISFSNDITQGANITLLKNADASTFIHELGHFFLEVYADVASKPDAPQSIVDDMNKLFNWFGIESTEQPALDVWRNMTIDQKRFYHEKLARGFEQYAMEGTAPTLELSRVFAKLRSFMLSAYKSLKQFFERSGDPGLTKEVRQVFDRMLASEDAINKAQAVRGMMPMFASMEEAGMSIDEYAEYLQNQQDATDEAKAALTARSLRDMKWLQGARSRVIRDLQRQADTERRAVRMQVRREVMTQPVYQAYSWLKQIPDETKAQQAEKVKATKGVDVEKDSLYTAIAKLGGLNRELAAAEWGLDPKDRFDSGVFGKPVLRKDGGLSVDEMAEALAQYSYLSVDENGKWDLREFEDKFFEEARGEKQYSLFAEGEQYRKWQESIYDDQERARLDAFGKGKLDLNSMKAMYGEEGEWRNLGIGRTGMVMTDGVAPDAVAELFGFNSGDQLVKSLLEAENPKSLIDRLTDERMLAEFGDLVDAKKMNEAADKAVHNEVRARVLATELSAQNKALGNRRLLDAAAKEYANRQVAKQLVRDLKPSKYTRAESKSAQLAEKATKQGDTQTAVQAKRDQLLNNRAAKATVEAIDKIESTLKYLKKFDSEGVRKNLDIEYLEQIDDILSRFDLRSGQSLKAIDKRKSLLQWVESQKEIGLSPVVDEDLLNEARLVSYKDLPFEQFMALADSIKNIEHLGRLKKTLLTAKDKREFAERMAEARESINNNANRIVPERATPNDFVGKLARFGRRFSAAHRKFSSFMRELDGGKDLGVMQDMLLYSMYEAGSLETDLRAKATEDMQRLFATIEGKIERGIGNLYAIKRVVPGTNISLTHEQRIMFAMNWGNDGNRQRLLDGGLEGTRSISNEDAAAILDTITKEEWDFIQGVWDYIATYKPMIAEQELRLTGREPVWIEPSPVNTKFGTYAGGYFPAKYDAQMSTRSESLEAVTDLRMAMKGAFNASGTRDGYTQARAEAVKGRPILLSFDTISRHIHEVTHRLAWQEWLTDATRAIKALDADIREKLGAEALQEMHQHIRDVAIGDAPVTGTTDVLLSRIRNGTSIVGMGYRVSTALMQPSGIFQSWARLGINATANGVKTFLKNPVKTHQWIMENSPMMRNRASTLNREINEIVNQVRAGKNLTRLQASYFYLIGKMQMMIDTPTYIGAYEKALADLNYESAATEDERQSIEKKAHLFAGQTVIDTQTGGEIKDLAGVQKGSQGQKLFTNFYSYFSALYNLNVENFRAKKLANPAEFADFVATALLLNVMPVIYTVALKNLLKGECNWDDTECLLSRYKSEQMGAIFGQMIGLRDIGVAADVATGGDAYGYSGPPSLKFFSEIYKFGQQADQGDIDMPMFKALNNAGGILFHYPAGQINSTLEGMMAIERGEVEGVSIFGALISGPPRD